MRIYTTIPRYKSHKTVRAFKIKGFIIDPDDKKGGAAIVPVDGSIEDVPVDKSYMDKHKPQKGGYYVQYEDGYESYSPAKAFEEGYSKV